MARIAPKGSQCDKSAPAEEFNKILETAPKRVVLSCIMSKINMIQPLIRISKNQPGLPGLKLSQNCWFDPLSRNLAQLFVQVGYQSNYH